MTPTNFRKPRTEATVRVQFRNGRTSIHAYTVAQLRWTNSGSDWDAVAWVEAA